MGRRAGENDQRAGERCGRPGQCREAFRGRHRPRLGQRLAPGKSGNRKPQSLHKAFPCVLTGHVTKMYETFNSRSFGGKGFAISDEQFEDTKKLLGREPYGYEEFVKAEVAEWTK